MPEVTEPEQENEQLPEINIGKSHSKRSRNKKTVDKKPVEGDQITEAHKETLANSNNAELEALANKADKQIAETFPIKAVKPPIDLTATRISSLEEQVGRLTDLLIHLATHTGFGNNLRFYGFKPRSLTEKEKRGKYA